MRAQHIAVVVCLALPVVTAVGALQARPWENAASESHAERWVEVSEPPIGSSRRQCANWTEWTVELNLSRKGAVEATKVPIFPTRILRPDVPFPLGSEIRPSSRVLTKRAGDGYVVAVNDGEFGGSVWWFDLRGGSRRHLGNAHVIGFFDVELPGRRVVTGLVEGLAHMGMDEGSIRIVERVDSGALRLTTLHTLPSAPQVVGPSTTTRTVVATGSGLISIDKRGTFKPLASVDLRGLYPRSIVEDPSGRIYVGMRRYYLTVRTTAAATRVSWYTDATCRTFRPVRPASCECH
jgi:hypothetical protein